MSYSYTSKSYTTQTSKTTSPSQAIEDSKKKASLLKDNSWIKRDIEEDDPVDEDPNFGRTVLSRYKSNETLDSTAPEKTSSPTVKGPSASVQALTKRFSASQDELNKSSSTPPASSELKTTSYTRSTLLKSETPKTTNVSTVVNVPKTSTTSTVTKDGKTTETTVITTQSVSSSPVIKTPTKTETFTERVFSDVKSSSKGSLYSPTNTKVTETTSNTSLYSPTKTVKVTETTSNKSLYSPTNTKVTETTSNTSLYSPTKTTKVTETTSNTSLYSPTKTVKVTETTSNTAEDKLYDTLIPKSIKSDVKTAPSTTSVTKTETVTVKSSLDGDGIKTTTTKTISSAVDDPYDKLLLNGIKSDVPPPVRDTIKTTKRTSSTTENELYGTLLPKSMTSIVSSSVSTDIIDSTSTRRSYSTRPDYSYEHSSITSPTAYTSTTYKESRVDDRLSDPIMSKSSIKTVYSSPESTRMVLEKDLCSYCHKPFNTEAKMILEDMKINCHASCFKCEVCNSTLGHMKAGDSMWIYRRTVHCERCFDITREKWRR